jgi:hypothetical protein
MRIVLTVSLLALHAVAAQPAPQVRLGAPTATLAEEFSNIVGVRELRDGRVLVSDRREKRVVVADFAKGTVEQVGRAGEGPLEYSAAEAIWAIGGDSGIIFLPPQRWVVFSANTVAGILGADAAVVRATKSVIRGVDTAGRVLWAPIFSSAAEGQRDSVPLVLTTRGTARLDTITRLKTQVPSRKPIDGMPGYFQFFPPTMSMFEQAAQSADGWTAVVRSDPYRVDWRSPDGRWVKGQPIAIPTVGINEREKLFYLEQNPAPPGPPGSPARTPQSIIDWPATVPAVGAFQVVYVAPDGRLLVPRYPSAGQPESRYDIVDRRGRLNAQLSMAPKERIAGTGAKSLYVVETDADGIRRLKRHAWPPIAAK